MTTPTGRCCSHLLVLGLVLGLAAPARADDPEALLKQGIVHFATGQLDESLKVLDRALQAASDPGLRGKICLYIGLNHAIRKKTHEASTWFRKALTHDPLLTLDPQRFKPDLVSEFEAARSRTTGQIRVSADRADAVVLVDGRQLGETPFKGKLPVGAHQVEVRTTDGQYGYAKRIVVAAGKTQEMSVKLRQLTASLEVSSSPPGALILLDNKPAGRTPAVIEGVTGGTHVLKLGKAGYLPSSQTVFLTANVRAKVEVSLQRTGRIAVSSDPPGATVNLDGEWVAVTPAEVPVRPGSHFIELEMAGRLPQSRKVKVAGGERVALRLTLQPRPTQAVAPPADVEDAGTIARRHRSKSIRAYVGMAVGAAALVAAGVVHGLARSQGNTALGRYSAAAAALDTDASRQADIDAERDEIESANSKLTASYVLLGVAGAAFGYSAYELLTRPSVAEPGSEPIARQRRRKTVLAYTALGVGLATAVSAGVVYGLGQRQGSDALGSYMEATATPYTDSARQEEVDGYRSDLESANGKLTASYVLFGVAAAALGYSAYEFFTRPAPVQQTRTAAIGLAPTRGGATFSLGGSF